MSRCLSRISLVLVLMLSGEVWALGLGDIRLDSALNEPLRAEIELLSATPEELTNLAVTLASADTFERYGIDRPHYLQGIEFNVVANGPQGPLVQLRSRSPIAEPFLTFLVEATWSSGRLLREYTVLLDPPTYAPPAVQQAPVVQAPRRAAPTDSARIERQPAPQPAPRPAPQTRAPVSAPAPVAEPAPVVEPAPATSDYDEPAPATSDYEEPAPATSDYEEPAPATSAYDEPAPEYTPAEPQYEAPSYSTNAGGDYVVTRGDTLWSIASRMRPDSRLSMNQTMLAIYEANPQAFGGNINVLRAGGSLRIPSADEVFQINRGDALAEVQRQHSAWGGVPGVATTADYADDYGTDYAEESRTSLTLVPPDEEPAGVAYDDTIGLPPTREEEIVERISQLETADVPDQQSLIEIRDNELAALRQELAEIRGEVYVPPVDETVADEAVEATTDEIFVDEVAAADEAAAEAAADEAAAEEEAAEEEARSAVTSVPTTIVRTQEEPGLVDRIMGVLSSIWTRIIAALLVVAGLLLWFVRRNRGDVDDSGPWEELDQDDLATGAMTATETLGAPQPDEAIMVVESQEDEREHDRTIEVPAPPMAEEIEADESLEDTFSSETAINLDQTDPIAEADFHMAYGLYDQAADLINGALEADAGNKALMAKLCEIYFVWGNRDAFVDAATRLQGASLEGDSAEWNKIVIMGQQIASDHEMFAGVGVAGATKAVDLSFGDEEEAGAELDMDFGGDLGGASDVIDLGEAAEATTGAEDDLDFVFEEATELVDEETAESAAYSLHTDETAEMPAVTEATAEMPTIEQDLEHDFEQEFVADDITAEDISAEDEASSLPSLDGDFGDVFAASDADTGVNEALAEQGFDADADAVTGTNFAADLEDTGVREGLDLGATAIGEGLDLSDLEASGSHLALDETGQVPGLVDADEPTDTAIEEDLLAATGRTQILSEDLAVETMSDIDDQLSETDATMLAPIFGDDEPTEVAGDAETILASLDEDEDDFDFAKTESLPADAFADRMDLDETGELPAVAHTDVDLDLDDLTAALQVSEVGDTVQQPRDDATVEQPRPSLADETAEVPTMSLAPEDLSDDLHEARTMTEVGTKLDLARAYVDMGDPSGARSILEEVLDEGDEGQRQQAQQLLDSLPG